MRAISRKLVDRLATALVRRGFGAPAPDVLDAYGREAPSPQQAVDIFKGRWSSQFPAGLGLRAGAAALFEDPRLQRLIELAGGIEDFQILELGPLEGGHSYMLQRAGARSVLAIEACVLSYLKCLIVKELVGLQRVTFGFGNFMPFLASSTGQFDLIVASGVLYHQSDPLRLLQLIARRSNSVFLWTHYYQDGADSEHIKSNYFTRVPGVRLDGFECDLFRLEYDTYLKHGHYRGGVDPHACWMQRGDLLACLRHFGLTQIDVAFEQPVHPFGPNLTLLAQRPSPRV